MVWQCEKDKSDMRENAINGKLIELIEWNGLARQWIKARILQRLKLIIEIEWRS